MSVIMRPTWLQSLVAMAPWLYRVGGRLRRADTAQGQQRHERGEDE